MLMVAIGHQAGLAIENTEFYKAKLQAERLAAVGQTIATLSHHIKNILQGIRGGSYLIDMGLKETDDAIVRRGWTIVEKNQGKIYNLVMDMLSFSKDREPALEPSDLNETVGRRRRADAVARRRTRRGARLAARRPTCPPVMIDPDGIHRAVLNIVTNAIDAAEGVAGARVVVSTAWDAEARRPRVVGRRQRGRHRRGGDRLDLPGLRLDQGVARDGPGPARLAEDRPRARRQDRRHLGGRPGLEVRHRAADAQGRAQARHAGTGEGPALGRLKGARRPRGSWAVRSDGITGAGSLLAAPLVVLPGVHWPPSIPGKSPRTELMISTPSLTQ